MIIKLKKTINVGDLGNIYLMYWFPNKKDEIDDDKRYFSVYYSNKYHLGSMDFTAELDDNGIVCEGSNTYMILETYIKEQLENNEHLFADSEEAVFDVFKRLFASKMLAGEENKGA